MVYRFLRPCFLSQVRSPFWERSLIVNTLLALLALYLLLNFLALGYFLDVILAESFSGQDIIEVANGFLLYTLLGGLFARFMVQNFPMLDIQPYLLLPIKRNRLYHFLLIRSVFNLFNLMPLVVALPFAVKVVYHRLGTVSGTAWVLVILVLSLANHFLAFYLKRQFNLRPLVIVGLLVLLGGLVTLDVQGVVSFSAAFGRGIALIVEQPVFLVLPIAILLGVYGLLYRAMHYYSYLDTVEQKREQVQSGKGIAALRRLGMAGHFMQLELRQIWRNKRPRTMLVASLFFLLYPIMLMIMDDGDDAGGSSSLGFFLVLIALSFPMVNYGQFLIAWESRYFNLLMARHAPLKDYLKGKYYLFLLFNVIGFLIGLVYGFLDAAFFPIVLSAFLFISGTTVYITLFLATYNTQAVDPAKSAFMNWEGVGGSQFLMILPTFFLPLLLYSLLLFIFGEAWALVAMGGIGLLGMALFRPVLRQIEKQLQARKHILIDSYKP